MGTGLYPQFVSGLMCQVGVSKFVDCCRVAGWWTPIFFCFCFVRLPIVDGTGCLVWWSVKFVFRIVDGTGMFSVLSCIPCFGLCIVICRCPRLGWYLRLKWGLMMDLIRCPCSLSSLLEILSMGPP